MISVVILYNRNTFIGGIRYVDYEDHENMVGIQFLLATDVCDWNFLAFDP